MMLSTGDRLVILASLQWAAMEHDKQAKELSRRGNAVEASRRMAFSIECVRVHEIIEGAR